MRIPDPPSKWTPEYQARLNSFIEGELKNVRRRGDLEMDQSTLYGVTRHERVILKSPNGTRYALTVSDAGVLSATAV